MARHKDLDAVGMGEDQKYHQIWIIVENLSASVKYSQYYHNVSHCSQVLARDNNENSKYYHCSQQNFKIQACSLCHVILY